MRQKFSDDQGARIEGVVAGRLMFFVGSHEQQGDGSVDRNQGAARAISSFIDPGLSWKDMACVAACFLAMCADCRQLVQIDHQDAHHPQGRPVLGGA
jgi:hypothetical protein